MYARCVGAQSLPVSYCMYSTVPRQLSQFVRTPFLRMLIIIPLFQSSTGTSSFPIYEKIETKTTVYSMLSWKCVGYYIFFNLLTAIKTNKSYVLKFICKYLKPFIIKKEVSEMKFRESEFRINLRFFHGSIFYKYALNFIW